MPDSGSCTGLFYQRSNQLGAQKLADVPDSGSIRPLPSPDRLRTARCTSPDPANRMTGICPPRTAAPAPAGSTMPAAESTAPKQTALPQR